MGVVLSLVEFKSKKLEQMFKAFAEYAARGEAVGFGGFVRWADGSEQIVLVGPYKDSAQAVMAAVRMKRQLVDD